MQIGDTTNRIALANLSFSRPTVYSSPVIFESIPSLMDLDTSTEAESRPNQLAKPLRTVGDENCRSVCKCTGIHGILTVNLIFQVSQLALYGIKKTLEQGRHFILYEIPLVRQLHAHFPQNLSIPVFSFTTRGLMVSIIETPSVILGCIYPWLASECCVVSAV